MGQKGKRDLMRVPDSVREEIRRIFKDGPITINDAKLMSENKPDEFRALLNQHAFSETAKREYNIAFTKYAVENMDMDVLLNDVKRLLKGHQGKDPRDQFLVASKLLEERGILTRNRRYDILKGVIPELPTFQNVDGYMRLQEAIGKQNNQPNIQEKTRKKGIFGERGPRI
jgi:hypothetical protein